MRQASNDDAEAAAASEHLLKAEMVPWCCRMVVRVARDDILSGELEVGSRGGPLHRKSQTTLLSKLLGHDTMTAEKKSNATIGKVFGRRARKFR